MPTTSNFGWTTPADTDLVKDGAAAIRTLGNGVDASFVDLKGGTTGQILSKNSNTDLDYVWINNDQGDITGVTAGTGLTGGGTSGAVTLTNDMATTITASGDIVVGTGNGTYDNLPIGTTGQVLTADTTVSPYKVKWASVGGGAPVWTQRNAGTGTLTTIAYNGSNLYVAAGQSGALFTSTDAATWTSRTSGFGSQTINRVIYANSLWVAVGDNGLISTSSDGTTWTARTANFSTNNINDVWFANSVFVAVGQGGGNVNTGGLTYSTDGFTWTRKSQTFTDVSSTYYAVTYNGTNWLIGAQGGSTKNAITASTPSGTWTEIAIGTGTGNATYVHYDGTRTWLVNQTDGGFLYSTSSTYATFTSIDTTEMLPPRLSGIPLKSQISIYDGKIYQSNGYYYQRVGATPVNTNYLYLEHMSLAPSLVFSTTTPYFGGSSTSPILANASGIVIGGTTAKIFTSF